MTREEIDKLEPGHLMDVLVHQVIHHQVASEQVEWHHYSREEGNFRWRSVVNSWKGDIELRRQNGNWKCTLFIPSYEYEMWGKTVAEAVCKAALLYYEERKQWN